MKFIMGGGMSFLQKIQMLFMKPSIKLILSLLVVVLFTSCVSNKKYMEAVNNYQSMQTRNGELQASINSLQTEIDKLKKQMAEDDRLSNERLTSLRLKSQEELNEQIKRLENMQRLMASQREAIEQLRKKMADALVNFNSNELSVFVKNGKVYVSMQESLLFPSGSAAVNPKGKEALNTLAQVLNNNMDINVLIEGHTDSVPMRGRYEDNWALSVARSTAIVRLLTDTYNVDPERVTASGRSKYEPIDTNSTPEGRARNRRTEIILAPKLDQLMQLLEQSANAGVGTQ